MKKKFGFFEQKRQFESYFTHLKNFGRNQSFGYLETEILPGLKKYGAPYTDRMFKMLKNEEDNLEKSAILVEVLGALKYSNALEVLIHLLENESLPSWFRQKVALALGEINDDRVIPVLTRIQKITEPRSLLHNAIGTALHVITSQKSQNELVRNTILKVLSDFAEQDLSDISGDTPLSSIGLTDIDLIEAIMEIEDQLGIKFQDLKKKFSRKLPSLNEFIHILESAY